ncbi:MAG: ABC-F family ATP-binding cassette domain-containing protein [Pseudomonadota bacterium]|jgi:ATPase subunit of ABC transporter with duplicated ATPase domains|nr:ATP-binding cassette domain-containing protein [Alphaproteobacteria bacterium]
MTTLIQIQNLGIFFPHKTCFENFSTDVHTSSRIAIIGQNGSGKSTLLKILLGDMEPSSGIIRITPNTRVGYVPQVIDEFKSLSGGQRFNAALTQVLSQQPDILLLDEPTNHLDFKNRQSLMHMLRQYQGTLIAISHDIDFLGNCAHILWHIDDGNVHIFKGTYDAYMNEARSKRASIEHELRKLERQKKEAHHSLMKEQERASKRKSYGEKKYADDKMALRAAQGQGENTHNKNKKKISHAKNELVEQLVSLRLPEIITPKFSIQAATLGDQTIVSINDGCAGYSPNDIILRDLYLSMSAKSRIAICGNNGSGKSTLIKAILGDKNIIKSGDWLVPNDVGYLDQHYGTICLKKTVIQTISELAPSWDHAELRRHLNDFLFRKNDEIQQKVESLSGGEKMRLSLAQIAAKTQKLLILDEITNNIDLTTKEHLLEFLNAYPGGFIIVCHDEGFLEKLSLDTSYIIENKTLKLL